MLEINKIYHGDCLELMPEILDKSVDMVLCDLPYQMTACHWDKMIPFEPLWAQYKRIIKDNGAIVLTASQPFTTDLINSNRKWFKYEWIWVKNRGSGVVFSHIRPMRYHENILIFYRKQPIYNPQFEEYADSTKKRFKEGEIHKIAKYKYKIAHYGKFECRDKIFINPKGRVPSSIQYFKTVKIQKDKLHSSQKPVALFEYFIRTYTNKGDLVLDNCIGSGTTAVACIHTNRNFIGMEIDKNYFDMANKRIEKEKEKMKSMLINPYIKD